MDAEPVEFTEAGFKGGRKMTRDALKDHGMRVALEEYVPDNSTRDWLVELDPHAVASTSKSEDPDEWEEDDNEDNGDETRGAIRELEEAFANSKTTWRTQDAPFQGSQGVIVEGCLRRSFMFGMEERDAEEGDEPSLYLHHAEWNPDNMRDLVLKITHIKGPMTHASTSVTVRCPDNDGRFLIPTFVGRTGDGNSCLQFMAKTIYNLSNLFSTQKLHIAIIDPNGRKGTYADLVHTYLRGEDPDMAENIWVLHNGNLRYVTQALGVSGNNPHRTSVAECNKTFIWDADRKDNLACLQVYINSSMNTRQQELAGLFPRGHIHDVITSGNLVKIIKPRNPHDGGERVLVVTERPRAIPNHETIYAYTFWFIPIVERPTQYTRRDNETGQEILDATTGERVLEWVMNWEQSRSMAPVFMPTILIDHAIPPTMHIAMFGHTFVIATCTPSTCKVFAISTESATWEDASIKKSRGNKAQFTATPDAPFVPGTLMFNTNEQAYPVLAPRSPHHVNVTVKQEDGTIVFAHLNTVTSKFDIS